MPGSLEEGATVPEPFPLWMRGEESVRGGDEYVGEEGLDTPQWLRRTIRDGRFLEVLGRIRREDL
jgi:hypothetical protein